MGDEEIRGGEGRQRADGSFLRQRFAGGCRARPLVSEIQVGLLASHSPGVLALMGAPRRASKSSFTAILIGSTAVILMLFLINAVPRRTEMRR